MIPLFVVALALDTSAALPAATTPQTKLIVALVAKNTTIHYKNTKINVVWIPWANASTDFSNALTSGKNAPDITEIGNTETPTEAELGALSNLTSNVKGWSSGSDLVPGAPYFDLGAVIFLNVVGLKAETSSFFLESSVPGAGRSGLRARTFRLWARHAVSRGRPSSSNSTRQTF